MVVDVGAVGSPVDVATFLSVLYLFRGELRPRVETTEAAVVALAQLHREVDDDALQNDLDVDDQEIEAVETTIIEGDQQA